MGNLARYIIRASISQEKMTNPPEESRIIWRSKDKRQEKTFDALNWLAAMTSHIPDQAQQMVRYSGFYSKDFLGFRQNENKDAMIPFLDRSGSYQEWDRLPLFSSETVSFGFLYGHCLHLPPFCRNLSQQP